MPRFATPLLALLVLTAAVGRAQQPRLSISPTKPEGGTLTRVIVELPAHDADSIVSARGEMAGEPLHFRPASARRVESLGAVPLAPSDSVVARVVVVRASGRADSLRLFLRYPHQPPPPTVRVPTRAPVRTATHSGARRLTVDRRFTQAMDSATTARVDRENETARMIGRASHDTPALWTLPFLRPRSSRVTSRFGSGRLFNGRLSSNHLGIDYRGATGDPIYAANRGVVRLVAEFFLAGNVVYVDHGEGLITAYFHMSQPEVAAGDTVERGQEIGRVGATGRVTGPHLHWAARYGALTIDPGALLVLAPPFVSVSSSRGNSLAGGE